MAKWAAIAFGLFQSWEGGSEMSYKINLPNAENSGNNRQRRAGRDSLVHLCQFPTPRHCLIEKGWVRFFH